MVKNYYANEKPSLLYRDLYVVYKNMLQEELKELGFNTEVKLFESNIETNRANLVLIKRVNSPQPPNIHLLNQKVDFFNRKEIIESKNITQIYLEFSSYGNSYLEAENIGANVLGILNSSAIDYLRRVSNGSIVGHEILNWSETTHQQDTPLFVNTVAIRVTFILVSSIYKGS